MSDLQSSALALGRFLGSGSNKKVHVTTINGQEVALMRGCSKCEINLLYELREAAHIVQVQQTCSVHTVAVELAEHGSIIDLQDTLEFEGKAVTSDHITVMILQVQVGLNAVWDLGYVHGDVAERNVLVFRYNSNAADTLVKLGDFGDAYESQNLDVDIAQLIAMNLRLRQAWSEHLAESRNIPALN